MDWSWKIKTAVPGMNGELADIFDAAKTDGVRNLEEIFKEDVDANKSSMRAEDEIPRDLQQRRTRRFPDGRHEIDLFVFSTGIFTVDIAGLNGLN